MKKRYYIAAGILAFLVGINILFFLWSPAEIVSVVGVQNAYLIAFAVAAVGGLSTLTGPALYTAIITFAAGGAEPWLLGITAGFGIFVSDSIFFHLALYGRRAVPPAWAEKLERMNDWMENHPTWLVLLLSYIYLGLTPLPNDLLMIALVVGNYSYKKVFPALLLGGLTIATITAYIGNIWDWLI